MSDYRTEQQAAALWRALEQKMDAKIAQALRLPSGITPGTAYGSVIFDAFGRAIWGGAGSGGAAQFCHVRSGGVSVSSGTAIRVPMGFGSSVTVGSACQVFSSSGTEIGVQLLLNGLYHIEAQVGWANTESGWRILTIAEENVTMDGGFGTIKTDTRWYDASGFGTMGHSISALWRNEFDNDNFISVWVNADVDTTVDFPTAAAPGFGSEGTPHLFVAYLGAEA